MLSIFSCFVLCLLLFCFVFSFALGDTLKVKKEILLWFMSKSLLSSHPGDSWFVWCLDLYTILTSFLYMILESILILCFCRSLFSFPSITYWRDCLFSIVYFQCLSHRLIDQKYLGILLAPLFCSTDVYVCFSDDTMMFCLL